MAEASVHVMELDRSAYETHTGPMLSHINVGTGIDVTIAQLAEAVQKTVGFKGQVVFDASKPDGTPRKLMNVSKLTEMGWAARTDLEMGLKKAYEDFLMHAKT
jgi:GDP-L-fucose synthase